MHNFTPEDLLQYLYNETSPAQTAQIKAALETDWSLREKFEVITSAQKRLEINFSSVGEKVTLRGFDPRRDRQE